MQELMKGYFPRHTHCLLPSSYLFFLSIPVGGPSGAKPNLSLLSNSSLDRVVLAALPLRPPIP